MTMGWWWSTAEEETFQAALAPRVAIHRALMWKEHGLATDLQDEELERLLRAFRILFVETLRRACVLRLTAQDAADDLAQLTAPMSAAFAKRAEQLKRS
jgi:hypothetical protein